MESYIHLLQKSSLFAGISAEEIEKLCTCLAAREKSVSRGAFVFRAGDDVRFIYLLLSGSMHIIDEDPWGDRSLIETMSAYTLFGEAYVFASRKKQLVSVIAAEDARILEIDPMRLFETCLCGCDCHAKLLRNTLAILSEKIVRLTEKLGHVAQRSTRAKVLSYLSKCARQEKSCCFEIPYSRQQLADYLCVDRSALSHELSKLRKAGMIQYRKNYFELRTPQENALSSQQ